MFLFFRNQGFFLIPKLRITWVNRVRDLTTTKTRKKNSITLEIAILEHLILIKGCKLPETPGSVLISWIQSNNIQFSIFTIMLLRVNRWSKAKPQIYTWNYSDFGQFLCLLMCVIFSFMGDMKRFCYIWKILDRVLRKNRA